MSDIKWLSHEIKKIVKNPSFGQKNTFKLIIRLERKVVFMTLTEFCASEEQKIIVLRNTKLGTKY
jgi:hypothetical protein